MRARLLFTAVLFLSAFHAKAQQDSVYYQRDSVVEVEADCTESFFQRTKTVAAPAQTLLTLSNGKTYKLYQFVKPAEFGPAPQYGLIDLDDDKKNELVIYNFTGGAHCCDEIYIFRNTAPNKYQQAGKMFAGNTCITQGNEFVFDFYEQFGYFFTCYACAWEDSSDVATVPVHSVTLRYNKGALVVKKGDAALKTHIIDQLAVLSEQPYEKMDEDISQDNGLRKEFALNLAVYYYSFGRNLPATQALFSKYYKFPDAKKVWVSFNETLKYIKQQNRF